MICFHLMAISTSLFMQQADRYLIFLTSVSIQHDQIVLISIGFMHEAESLRWHTTQGPMLSLGSGCGRASGHDKSRSANGVKMMGIRISGCDHQRQWKGQALDGMVNEALHKLVRTLRIGSPREWKPGAKVEKKGRRKRRHSNSQSSPGKRAEKLTFAWNPASGPRKGGEGVEDLLQGLTGAQCLSDGSLQLNMTLLVAGFIIGPSGASIHGIIEKTGARISSWTQHSGQHDKRNTRVFVIKGTAVQMSHAVKIVLKAICRYKELAEGGYLGRLVDSVQTIEGVEFLYRPPPKDKVPYAASVDRTGKKKLQRDSFCFSVEKSGGIGELPTVPDEIACHKTA